MIRETLREMRLAGTPADTPTATEPIKQKEKKLTPEEEAAARKDARTKLEPHIKATAAKKKAAAEKAAAEKAAAEKAAAEKAAAGEAGAIPEQQQQAQADTQQQQAAAKPAMKAARSPVKQVVTLMGKNAQIKKLFPRIKADEIMKAQFFAVMADQLGVPPDELSPLVVKIKAQQKAMKPKTQTAPAQPAPALAKGRDRKRLPEQ